MIINLLLLVDHIGGEFLDQSYKHCHVSQGYAESKNRLYPQYFDTTLTCTDKMQSIILYRT